MTNITSEDVFLGRKQEDFDLAEKLLVKHGKLNTKCVREMMDAVDGRTGIVECHEILKRVWDDMHVKKHEDENAKLRKIARLYIQAINDCGCEHCPHYDDGECAVETEPMRDGCKLYAEMRELGIEVD